MPRAYSRRPLIDRVFDHVIEIDGHWIWTGSVGSSGYGQISEGGHDGRDVSVHRTVWEHFRGEIPNGLQLDHLGMCLRILCCNPFTCLEPVTHAENQRRRAARIYRCRNGHEYTAENTRTTRGFRECRACGRAKEQRRRVRARRQDYATVCDNGHVRDAENTVVQANGLRCRTCTSEAATARHARARLLKGSGMPQS